MIYGSSGATMRPVIFVPFRHELLMKNIRIHLSGILRILERCIAVGYFICFLLGYLFHFGWLTFLSFWDTPYSGGSGLGDSGCGRQIIQQVVIIEQLPAPDLDARDSAAPDQ